MGDFFQKFKKQDEINESLFNNLFGKKSPQTIPSSGGIEIIENTDNTISIKFENGSFAKEVNTLAALPYLKRIDFNSSKFSFLNLPGTKFNASYLELDLQTQEVKNFIGDWESGPFTGFHFEGTFNGSSFNGNFIGDYTKWESSPIVFIDGTFIDTADSGLLGSPNMTTLPQEVSKDTNLIFMPVGYYFQFRSKKGISGYIKTLKRLDNVNSDFKFEILNGFKSQNTPYVLNLTWTQIRQSWNNLFVNPNNTKSLAGLITVLDDDEIVEMYISSSLATFKTPALEFNPKTIYTFNLSKIPDLFITSVKGAGGKFTKPEVGLKFRSKDEFDKYNEIVSYINSGVFKQDVKDINRGVKYGEIDGYGPFDYLKFVFNNIKGTRLVPEKEKTRRAVSENIKGNIHTHKFKTPDLGTYTKEPGEQKIEHGIIPAMNRMNDFVKYFVENITMKSGELNSEMQNLIISKLKIALGTDNIQKPIVSPEPTKRSEPGMSSVDAANTFSIKESFRKKVRNIIKDSF